MKVHRSGPAVYVPLTQATAVTSAATQLLSQKVIHISLFVMKRMQTLNRLCRSPWLSYRLQVEFHGKQFYYQSIVVCFHCHKSHSFENRIWENGFVRRETRGSNVYEDERKRRQRGGRWGKSVRRRPDGEPLRKEARNISHVLPSA